MIVEKSYSKSYLIINQTFLFCLLINRHGKKKMDNRSFFGGMLHVFYAPEYESEEDTRGKLAERKRVVLRKCQGV